MVSRVVGYLKGALIDWLRERSEGDTVAGANMVSNQYDNIPPELKTYHNWVCGDLNKAPINPKQVV